MEKRSKDFDQIIKDKLNGLSVGSNPGDWILMERLLEMEGLTKDSDAADEVRFDEVALDKLQNIPTAEFIPDWDRMSGMLDEINEEPTMEPSEFDQAIDNKIKDTQLPLAHVVWNRMEPTLDADRASVVQEYDDIAKEKLTRVSDEVHPAWGSMNSKINRELFLPESIVKYKVLEVALILLFAFSLSQFPLQEVNTAIANKIDNVKTERNQEEILPTSDMSNALASEDIIQSPEVDQAISVIEAEIKEDIAPLEVIISNTEIVEPVTSSQAVTPWSATSFWNLPPTIGEVLKSLKQKPKFSISRLAIASALFKIEAEEASTVSSILNTDFEERLEAIKEGALPKVENTKSFTPKKELAQDPSDIDAIDIDNIEFAKRRPFVDEALKKSSRNGIGLVLGLFSGSDYNEILTPFDQIYEEPGSKNWSIGYLGGVSLGMQFKNWELETGAIYASNQYQPQRQLEIHSGSISSGYIASTLKDIELDIVRVPLNFRFNVNLWNNWKVYALSGATINMVMNAEFITDDVFIGTKTFSTPGAPAFQNTALSLKDFSGGILDGGSFSNNSFLTANLGFGVERTLNTKWSIFAQPTYQRQIFANGIGPNQDRFNSISLFLGTRISLK